MKKELVSSIVLLAIILVFISSCKATGDVDNIQRSKTGELVAYEVCGTVVDSVYGGVHSDEYSMWTYEDMNMHIDKKAPKNKNVVFDGKTYRGTYTYSRVGQYNNYQSDRYEINQDGFTGWFTVISSTDKIDYISLPLPAPTPGDSAESGKGRNKAMELAGSVIDINEYKLSVDSNVYYDVYRFTKETDGVICASLTVAMNKDGEPAVFDYIMVDEYEEIKNRYTEEEIKSAVAKMTSDKAEEKIQEKIKSVYPYDNIESIKSIIKAKYLVILEDGRLGVVNDIGIEILTREESTGYTVGSGSWLSILVTEN